MRKQNAKERKQVTIVVKGIGPTRPKRQSDPGMRGRNPNTVAHRFKPGNQFGARPRRQLPKFADAYEVALLQEVPAALRKQLGVPKGTTMMDVLVQRVVEQAALNASIPHVTEIRETTQGKNPDRRITMTASIERLVQDPEFRQFVEQQFDCFLAQKGELSDGRSTTIVGTPSNEV